MRSETHSYSYNFLPEGNTFLVSYLLYRGKQHIVTTKSFIPREQLQLVSRGQQCVFTNKDFLQRTATLFYRHNYYRKGGKGHKFYTKDSNTFLQPELTVAKSLFVSMTRITSNTK